MSFGLTLIISSYNQAAYLQRVLRAVSAQTSPPEEVIVADDGSDDGSGTIVQNWAENLAFKVQRVWQPHRGFRRARILNLALSTVSSPYVVFLDGDSLPHPRFVGDHRLLAQAGHFVQGHRALVTKRGSSSFGLASFKIDRRRALWAGELKGLKHVFRWPLPYRRVLNHVDGVRGCNLAAWTDDIATINGYNEDYVGWGCEDLDLALRLIHSGSKRMDVRGRALCYHLWHKEADRSHLDVNLALLATTRKNRSVRCAAGLDQHPARKAQSPLGVS